MAARPESPVRVTLLHDHELVIHGLSAMMTPYSRLIEFVEPPRAGTQEEHVDPVDIVLYDTAQTGPHPAALGAFAGLAGATAVYTWRRPHDPQEAARSCGAAGYLSKALPARPLADALLRIAAGEFVVAQPVDDREDRSPAASTAQWPGEEHGLTQRQAEIVSLISSGLSNAEIAAETYLTVNTLKSYIRIAYRRMGVTTRAQAVLWAIEHGIGPRRAA